MENYKGAVIGLPSATYCMTAQKLLRLKGIDSELVRPDPSALAKGCSHGITLNPKRLKEAEGILIRHSIPISRLP